MNWAEHPDVLQIIARMKENNKSWNEIAQYISNHYDIFLTGNAVKKAYRRHFPSQGDKTLVLADLHSPYMLRDTILEIIKKHRHEVNHIVFNGDIQDCKEISSYPNERRMPFVKELIITYRFLKQIGKLTPGIRKTLIPGNHCRRLKKYLAVKGNQLNQLLSDNVLEYLVEGFNYYDREKGRKLVFDPLEDYSYVPDFWYQYKDVIFAHPNNFYSTPLKTAVETCNYFLSQGKDFNAILIGHTHQQGRVEHMGRHCYEIGCLCKPLEYQLQGNIRYRPQHYGYAVLEWTDGKFDVNKNRLIRVSLEQ